MSPLYVTLIALSAVTLLVGWHEEHLAHKILSDEVLACANYLHMVQLMPLPPSSLLQKNPEWFILAPAYTGCPGKGHETSFVLYTFFVTVLKVAF